MVDQFLNLLAKNPSARVDVAEVALLLARDEFPQLDVEGCLGEFAAMAHDVRSYLRGDLAAKLTGLCRYLFHEMGFHGNLQEYYDPANSYLNLVLERRTGIPISLCAVAMAVGNRAGLDIQGVGLPGHFIAKAVEGEQELLFDPFHGGRRLWQRDCENLVQQVTQVAFKVTPESLRAVPPGVMLQRMLNNLKAIYLSQSDFRRAVRIINRLRQLDPRDPLHHRDLGACYCHLDQPGKAITHLQAYLHAAPAAVDENDVRKMLLHAHRQIARWN